MIYPRRQVLRSVPSIRLEISVDTTSKYYVYISFKTNQPASYLGRLSGILKLPIDMMTGHDRLLYIHKHNKGYHIYII